jgi:hypothetical protein
MSFSDSEYRDIFENFEKVKLDAPDLPYEELFKWLHYRANLFMIDCYRNSLKKSEPEYKDWLKKMIRYLYETTLECYPEFISKNDLENYKVNFHLPSHTNMTKCAIAICDAGYPHQIMVFCYKTLINWNLEKIICYLSERSLDSIFDTFLNEYAVQSELPVFLVNLYFIKIKEKLNVKLKRLISKNDSVTPLKMEKYLNWMTGWTLLVYYYGKDKEHDIPDWCNKVKVRALSNLIKSLDIPDICNI